MNGELLSALERIEREKGISKEILLEAIESALVSAAKKVIDDPDIAKEDITVTMDEETGEINVYSNGELVENERFGRIAAQTAKQVIVQKIREAERDVIYEKYIKMTGNIVSGSVHRFDRGNVIVDLGDTEAIMPRSEQIPREKFQQGESVRAILVRVDRGVGAPEVILSRSDAGLVRKLFELEVPEISQGIVEIKAVAREAGERTKIAVNSKDDRVDSVGACVGMRGSRVRDIVRELHGERIDVVRWNDDIREYLVAAMNPAEIDKLLIDRENKHITLIVQQDQLSLAIGKKGRNIRLASKLLGWDLNVEAEEQKLNLPLSEVDGITDTQKGLLREGGLDTADKVVEADMGGLVSIKGVGKKKAESMLAACKEALTLAKKAAESKPEPEKKTEAGEDVPEGEEAASEDGGKSEEAAEGSEEAEASDTEAGGEDDEKEEAGEPADEKVVEGTEEEVEASDTEEAAGSGEENDEKEVSGQAADEEAGEGTEQEDTDAGEESEDTEKKE